MVVLPHDPVTAITMYSGCFWRLAWARRSKNSSQSSCSARSTNACCVCAHTRSACEGSSLSTTPAAPFASADSAKTLPFCVSPLNATNMQPFEARRESITHSLKHTSCDETTSCAAVSRAISSAEKSIMLPSYVSLSYVTLSYVTLSYAYPSQTKPHATHPQSSQASVRAVPVRARAVLLTLRCNV